MKSQNSKTISILQTWYEKHHQDVFDKMDLNSKIALQRKLDEVMIKAIEQKRSVEILELENVLENFLSQKEEINYEN